MSITFVVLTVNSHELIQQYQTHARVAVALMKTHHMWSGAHRQVAQLFTMSLTKIFRSTIFAVCLTPSITTTAASRGRLSATEWEEKLQIY
eukprot:scaffold680_cov79-Skeletonema_dohrnii-CCMP3373.AAC.2